MRLAHLSDTHILPDGGLVYGSIDSAARLVLAVEALNRLAPDLDAVVITGDLADQPSAAAYSTLGSILKALDSPYYLIPGNHDDRDMLRAEFGSSPALPIADGFANWVVDDFPVRLIGLDSTIAGSDLPEFCAKRAQWLDAQLAASPDKPTLLAIHHPPISVGLSMVDNVVASGWSSAFSEVVERHPQVRLICCGHAHTFLNGQLHHARVSMAPSTAFQLRHRLGVDEAPVRVDKPGGIVVHYWMEDGFVTVPFELDARDSASSIETLSGMSWTELKRAMSRRPI